MNWNAAGLLREIEGALAIFFSFISVAFQVRKDNLLQVNEITPTPEIEFKSVNTIFGTDPVFRHAVWQVVEGANRDQLKQDERTIVDYYMVSITTNYERISREVRAGKLQPEALNFQGKGIFSLPYFRSSWPLYRGSLGSKFAIEFEKQNELDPSIEANW